MSSFITKEDYISLLKNANNIICVKDYKNYSSGLILRHDVDISLDFAFDIYKLERDNGIKSTFYILLTSDLYNPFSFKNRLKLQEMVKNGFEVGLHFDPVAYGNSSNILENFKREILLFEKHLDIKLHSYSMHNPSITGEYIKYPKLIDAYSSDIFSDERYISDSLFSFKGKDLKEYIEKSNSSFIQLLIHPIHLISNGKVSYKRPIREHLKRYLEKIDTTLCVNRVYLKDREDILGLIG